MNKNIFRKAILSVSFLSLTHCASLGGKYDKEKVEKIRAVAIVGFTYDAPLETSDHIMGTLMGKEKTMGGGAIMGSKTDRIEGETPTSLKVYNELVDSLKKTGWKVKSPEEVLASASVKEYYGRRVKHGMLPLEQGVGRYERKGIPQSHHVASAIGKGDFAKLARDLNVDAIVAVYVISRGTQTVPMFTKINHSASVMIQIFDPVSDDLIMLSSSNGKEVGGSTKTKIGKDFLADVEKGALASVGQFGDDFSKRLKN